MNTSLQTNNKKVLGIIGGMGPLSTAELFHTIVSFTEARQDADHIHILIDNDPSVPDRTQAILGGSMEPATHIAQNIHKLAAQGAQVFIICCNTSHFFYDSIVASTGENIISMPKVTAHHAASKGYKHVCVLATDGTVRSGVYERALAHVGIETVSLSDENQKQIMDIIYNDIKAGRETSENDFCRLLSNIKSNNNVDGFLLGCTELSVAVKNMSSSVKDLFRFIDPLIISAAECVTACGGQLTDEARNILKE